MRQYTYPRGKISATGLDLHIKHRFCVDLDAKGRFDMVSKALLVALLDSGPLLLERAIVDELEKTFEFVQVLEPDFLLDAERLGDEIAQQRVALVEPTARSNLCFPLDEYEEEA